MSGIVTVFLIMFMLSAMKLLIETLFEGVPDKIFDLWYSHGGYEFLERRYPGKYRKPMRKRNGR